jgi:hypothetical protein
VTVLAHANNHAFDYGSSAILETIEHAGVARGRFRSGFAGGARPPQYFQCKVPLVAMASTASRSRPDPGGNTWHFSSAMITKRLHNQSVVRRLTARTLRQFGAFEVAARVLAERTRLEAQ